MDNFIINLLEQDEHININIKNSPKTLIVYWALVPIVYLFQLLVFFILKNIFSNISTILVIINFMKISIILLIICWAVICLYLTTKYSHSILVVTDKRILGKVGNKEFICHHSDIKNVYIEQGLLSKILGYGSIIIYAKGQSLRFNNIENPETLRKHLLDLNKDPYII